MSQDSKLRNKLQTYIATKKVQILKLTNDRISYCNSHQLDPKVDLRIMQLGLQIRELSEVQKVVGITSDELLEELKIERDNRL